jgi:Protein of unknown function (DUF4019)
MKTLLIICFISSFLFFNCSSNSSDDNPEIAEAVTTAQNWLSLVDSGQYSESWQTSSEIFRSAINQDQWAQTMTVIRMPLGNLLSRELSSKKYQTTLPGAPDGEYVVIVFKTSFSNKKLAYETITPMKEKDGKWRVSGYYIK